MASLNYDVAHRALNQDLTLRNQCAMFLLLKAVPDIVNESPEAPDHEARVAWAKAVEMDDSARSRAALRVAIRCIQNPTILATLAAGDRAEDSDVEYVALGAIPDLVAMGAY